MRRLSMRSASLGHVARLAGAMLLAVAGASGAPARADEGRREPSLVVVGAGEASTAPDRAHVHAGVVTEAASAAAAVESNNQAMSRVLATLAEAEIPREEIQTETLRVAPRYRQSSQGRREREIVAYQVTNQVRVTVADLEKLGSLLDALVRAGTNQIHGIQFSVSDPTRWHDEARRRAVADARRKAALYAEAAGVALGRVERIEEHAAGAPEPRLHRTMALGAEAAVPIAPGELDFHAQVTVTYAIESR